MGYISTFHASIRVDHVSAENLVPADQSCPVCLFSGPRAAVLRIQTTPDIFYLKCPSCGACSTSAMPSPVYLENYYNKYYAEADADVTIRNVNRFARHILNRVNLPRENNVLQILDFGGGDGSVAIAISEILIKENSARKTNIVLIDYSETKQINNQNISISKKASLGNSPTNHFGHKNVVTGPLLRLQPLHRRPRRRAALSGRALFRAQITADDQSSTATPITKRTA